METPNEKTPEWGIFERLEKLEKIRPTAKDAFTLAELAFVLAGATSLAVADLGSSSPRKRKDELIAALRKRGLSPRVLERVEKILIAVCESLEK